MEENSIENNIIKIDELMEKDLPPIRWLIDGLVPECGITIMPGASGSFKTWLAMEMAIAVASGTKFLDIFETRQANVLIVDEEGGERLYNERFKLLNTPEDIPIYLASMSGFTATEDSIFDLGYECELRNIRLVVIDSLVRINDGDENSSRDTSKLFSLLRLLTEGGISVLLIHHNRKPGPAGYNASLDMRGSSDIKAAVDILIAIRRIGESPSIEVRRAKNRYGEEGEPFKLVFKKDVDSGKVGFVYAGPIKQRETQDNDNTQKLRDVIIDAIEQLPLSNKGDVAKYVANIAKIGIVKIKYEIDSMIKDGIIISQTGPHNSMLLSLPENHDESKNGKVVS